MCQLVRVLAEGPGVGWQGVSLRFGAFRSTLLWMKAEEAGWVCRPFLQRKRPGVREVPTGPSGKPMVMT